MFDNGNFRRKRKRKADSVSAEKMTSPSTPASSLSPSSTSSSSSSSEPSPKAPRMLCSELDGISAVPELPSVAPAGLNSFEGHLQDCPYPPPLTPVESPAFYMQVPEHPSPPPSHQGHVSSFSPGAVVPQWDTTSPSFYSSLHQSPPPPPTSTLPLFPSSQMTFAPPLDPLANSPPMYTDLQTASSLQPELQEAQQLLQLQAHCESLFSGGFCDSLPLDSLVLPQ